MESSSLSLQQRQKRKEESSCRLCSKSWKSRSSTLLSRQLLLSSIQEGRQELLSNQGTNKRLYSRWLRDIQIWKHRRNRNLVDFYWRSLPKRCYLNYLKRMATSRNLVFIPLKLNRSSAISKNNCAKFRAVMRTWILRYTPFQIRKRFLVVKRLLVEHPGLLFASKLSYQTLWLN